MNQENIRLVIRILLLILYIILLAIQFFLFIQCIRKKNLKYGAACSVAAIASSVIAIGIMFFYDSLPGYGPMAGLTYFSEFMYSLGASVIFAGIFIISLLLNIIIYIIKKQKTI